MVPLIHHLLSARTLASSMAILILLWPSGMPYFWSLCLLASLPSAFVWRMVLFLFRFFSGRLWLRSLCFSSICFWSAFSPRLFWSSGGTFWIFSRLFFLSSVFGCASLLSFQLFDDWKIHSRCRFSSASLFVSGLLLSYLGCCDRLCTFNWIVNLFGPCSLIWMLMPHVPGFSANGFALLHKLGSSYRMGS